jgi:hypothetical protein
LDTNRCHELVNLSIYGIGGVLIELIGEGGCFTVNVISYLFVLSALAKIVYTAPEKTENKRPLLEVKEGFNYVKSNVPIRVILLTTTVFCFCIFF